MTWPLWLPLHHDSPHDGLGHCGGDPDSVVERASVCDVKLSFERLVCHVCLGGGLRASLVSCDCLPGLPIVSVCVVSFHRRATPLNIHTVHCSVRLQTLVICGAVSFDHAHPNQDGTCTHGDLHHAPGLVHEQRCRWNRLTLFHCFLTEKYINFDTLHQH